MVWLRRPRRDGNRAAPKFLEGSIDSRTDGAMVPRLDPLLEKGLMTKRERHPLSVVEELLKLQVRSQIAFVYVVETQEVFRRVQCDSHR